MTEVWLVETVFLDDNGFEKAREPHLIFVSKEAMMADWGLSRLECTMNDTDVVEWAFSDKKSYYASPWPVHGTAEDDEE